MSDTYRQLYFDKQDQLLKVIEKNVYLQKEIERLESVVYHYQVNIEVLVLEQRELCGEIEKCGASEQLTNTVLLASAIASKLQGTIDAYNYADCFVCGIAYPVSTERCSKCGGALTIRSENRQAVLAELQRELADYRRLYNWAASVLNTANNKLSKIRDIASAGGDDELQP